MKTTGFLLLEGQVELGFIADKKIVQAPSKQMIRRGLFHSTTALSNGGALLLEIETPNDKQDLVRLVDNYGRVDNGYESSEEWIPKNETHVWIETPTQSQSAVYKVNNSKFVVSHVTLLADIKELADDEIVMFLKGGLGKEIDNRMHLATVPGDIGTGVVIKKVAAEMEYLSPETIILKVSSNGSR
jgi:hypothetical protein